jgi:serine/threonine protein kinase
MSSEKIQLNILHYNLDAIIKNLSAITEKYEIIENIKVNHVHSIYRVKNRNDGRIRILKFITKTSVNDDFIRIHEFFANINCRNFCRIYSVEMIDIFYLITMEYIEGTNLRTFFLANPDKIMVHRLLYDLIFSLDFIHKKRIMHGDIKPENIIIKKNKIPVIIDYDICRFVDDGKLLKCSFGTKESLSPEVLNQNLCSTESDVWSLGVSLYCSSMGAKIDWISHEDMKTNNISSTIETNFEILSEKYGAMLPHLLKVMMIDDVYRRPTSETIKELLKKTEFYSKYYSKTCDSNFK